VDLKNPALPDKEFLSMGEVSRILSVPAYTLRYWETRVGLLRPARRPSGHRRYNRQDVETIIRIKDLIQKQRLTVAGARKALLDEKRGRKRPEGGEPTLQPSTSAKLLREVKKEIQLLMAELSR
jgi:DNA-binding transcriptional MerR regulator